jgi:hypothetical protein
VKVSVISVWFNEEKLAPFFLEHYRFADQIHVVVDSDTSDKTYDILNGYENVVLHAISFPDKFDDVIKIEKVNELYSSIQEGWVIAVDSDELVFSLPFEVDIKDILAREKRADVIYAQMWDVYRHRTDHDLDVFSTPVVLQRRHGSQIVDPLYTKPCVVRAGLDFRWECGCHKFARPKNKIKRFLSKVFNKPRISPTKLFGAHWRFADPLLVQYRVSNRKNRLSARQRGWGICLHFDDELNKLLSHCALHLDDLELF